MTVSVLKFQHSVGKSDLPPVTRHVALVLGTFADKISGRNAYPSIRTLQERSGRSRPTVIKAIRRLQSEGWIEVEERQGRGRGWRHRRYCLSTPNREQGGKAPLPRPARPSFYIKETSFFNQGRGDKSPSNPAAGHWRAVLEAVQRCGRYRVPDLPSAVMDAIRRIGGWSSICGAMEFDLRPGGPIFQRFKAAL